MIIIIEMKLEISNMQQVLPVLGQTAKLGQLYDANTGTFYSQQIFTVADIATACANASEKGTLSTYSKIITSTMDKFDFLSIEASLKLTLLTIGTFDGSGKYFKDNKTSSRSSMITLSTEVLQPNRCTFW